MKMNLVWLKVILSVLKIDFLRMRIFYFLDVKCYSFSLIDDGYFKKYMVFIC